MGLTIHYTIEFKGTTQQLQEKLDKIRIACENLPFEEVGKVETVEITQDIINLFNGWQASTETTCEERDKALEEAGVDIDVMLSAGKWKKVRGGMVHEIKPTTMVNLYIWPGEGCECCNLNFRKERGKFVVRSFCKTQYATHFARCHLVIIQLFDILKAEGFIMADIYDEGDYYETRDIEVLAKNINESTAMIASISEGLRATVEKMGAKLEAPIESCQNYINVDNVDSGEDGEDKPPF